MQRHHLLGLVVLIVALGVAVGLLLSGSSAHQTMNAPATTFALTTTPSRSVPAAPDVTSTAPATTVPLRTTTTTAHIPPPPKHPLVEPALSDPKPPKGTAAADVPSLITRINTAMGTVKDLTATVTGTGNMALRGSFKAGHICVSGHDSQAANSAELWSAYLPFSASGTKLTTRSAGRHLILSWRSLTVPDAPQTVVTLDAATDRLLSVKLARQTVTFSYAQARCPS